MKRDHGYFTYRRDFGVIINLQGRWQLKDMPISCVGRTIPLFLFSSQEWVCGWTKTHFASSFPGTQQMKSLWYLQLLSQNPALATLASAFILSLNFEVVSTFSTTSNVSIHSFNLCRLNIILLALLEGNICCLLENRIRIYLFSSESGDACEAVSFSFYQFSLSKGRFSLQIWPLEFPLTFWGY